MITALLRSVGEDSIKFATLVKKNSWVIYNEVNIVLYHPRNLSLKLE